MSGNGNFPRWPKRPSPAPCSPARTMPRPWPMQRTSSTSTSASARWNNLSSPDRARSACASSSTAPVDSGQRARQPPISPPTASPGWSPERLISPASRVPTPSPACPSPIPSVPFLSTPCICTLVTWPKCAHPEFLRRQLRRQQCAPRPGQLARLPRRVPAQLLRLLRLPHRSGRRCHAARLLVHQRALRTPA